MKSDTKLDFFKVSGDLVGVITNCATGLFWKGNFNPILSVHTWNDR